MKSIENNFDNPQVNQLLVKHFIELRSVSPEGSTHVLDIPGLKDPSIKFWSLWENNELIGCGALKFLDSNHNADLNIFALGIGNKIGKEKFCNFTGFRFPDFPIFRFPDFPIS